MITSQPANNHDDPRKVTDNILRDAGLTIEDSGGKVTIAGKDPVRKTVMKVGGSTAAMLAATTLGSCPWRKVDDDSEGKGTRLDEVKTTPQLLNEAKVLRQRIADLKKSQAQLEHVYLHAPVGLCYFDLELRYLHINEWLAETNGLSVQEHLGQRIQDLLPQVAAGVVAQLRQVIETGESIIEATVYIETAAHPGKKHLYEHSYYPRKSEDGTVLGVSCVVRDVTNRQRAYEKYQHLFDNAINMIHIVDGDRRIIDVNETEVRKLGYSREELIGKPFNELIHPEFRDETERIFAKVRSGNTVDSYETAFMTKDGDTIKVLANVVPHMVDGEFRWAQAITHDITAKDKLEEQLRVAGRLEAVGRLAGGVAHDFNNLLMAIVCFAGFVRDGLPHGDKGRDDIDEVLAAADKGVRLIRQLLMFTRQQPAVMQQIDLCDSLKGMENLLLRTIGEDIELTVSIPERPLRVLIDPVQLDQVILNLAVNARDAMPQGGSLKIMATMANIGCSRAANVLPAGRYVRIDIADSGVGMDSETMARIFEPYFTTKGPTEGTGIGLATCYSAMKQLRGAIDVDSDVGKGTTFSLYLPMSSETAEPDSSREVVRVDLRGDETVLVIEDEAPIRMIVQRTLRQHGYSVLIAEDGVQGLELFEANKETIDLVFSDVMLPRGNGFDVAEEVRRQRPEIPVLLTSGYNDPRVDCKTAELTIFKKPYAPAVLAQRIRACLDEHAAKVGRN